MQIGENKAYLHMIKQIKKNRKHFNAFFLKEKTTIILDRTLLIAKQFRLGCSCVIFKPEVNLIFSPFELISLKYYLKYTCVL